jgi:CHAT domain-containing protein
VKKPVCIILFLCSAVMACNRENTISSDWREKRFIQARLTAAKWKLYRGTELLTSCSEPADSRDKALDLLVRADVDCLDKAVNAVARHAREDLAAAYLTRFERRRDRRRDPDPVDLLRALKTAEGFNRALAQEWLGLNKEAIQSWDAVVREGSDWSAEATEHRDGLLRQRDPVTEWNSHDLEDAWDGSDTAALTRIAGAFPYDSARQFEEFDLRDLARARLLAIALATADEHYPMAVVEAMERTGNAKALEQGLVAFRKKDYRRAVTLLERTGNPLHLAARLKVAASGGPISILDAALPQLKPGYRNLSSRIYMHRAYFLEGQGKYLDAHTDYERALSFANDEPTATAAVLARRSANYWMIGDAGAAFRDAHRAVRLLPYVADTNTRYQAYGSAAVAAQQLGHTLVALHYQNTGVEDVRQAIAGAPAKAPARTNLVLASALRQRAEIHLAGGRNDDATEDLVQAAHLAEAAESPKDRDLLRMRVHEVRGQSLLRMHPAEAAAAFSEAIDFATEENSTYRAILQFKRAAAWRSADDRRADDDIAEAMKILRDEVRSALVADPRVASQPLWDPYFSRFREMYHELIESRIDSDDREGAFVAAELARAFEPMQILLSRSAPPGFHPIETIADLRQAHANLPADTVILQYLVLPGRTFTWIVTREEVRLVSQSTTRNQIERWVADAATGVAAGQSELFKRAMRAAYGELFRAPLKEAGPKKTRIVIVPDESMYGLPFNGLVGTDDEGYLIERGSIATAGSTSLYLYALARDRQFSKVSNSPVLLIGDPTFHSKTIPPLEYAIKEVEELRRDYYQGAEMLIGAEATVGRFLSNAKNAGIIHFAGHAVAEAHLPWQSRLLFAPTGQESGVLTAEGLMKELSRLERTRLMVLGACSTAGGSPVGPQGLAPLVRPLVGAGIPAIVASLWDVHDLPTKELLVSFHCHYQHGHDVADALRNAQLEILRRQDPRITPIQWAAFQVVGYAASPYPRTIAPANPTSEHGCIHSSLHQPKGLHPQ